MTARAVLETWAFAETAGVPSDVADQLAIVVEELVANVVDHGRAPADGVIRLRLEREEALIRIEISDPGGSFDPRDHVFDGPDPVRGGGAGLALVKAWAVIESWSRRNGRNELVLSLPCPEP